MAKVIVISDDGRVRIEVRLSDLEGDSYQALCHGCAPREGAAPDVIAGERERFQFEDAVQYAEIHADIHEI